MPWKRWDQCPVGIKPSTLARKQGVNDFGKVGYGGLCPPRRHGAHHYHFRLYALDAELNLTPRVTRKQLEAAMKGHITAEADLVGTFERE